MKKALAKAGIPQFSCIGLIFFWDTVNAEISVIDTALRACSLKHNNIIISFFQNLKMKSWKEIKRPKNWVCFLSYHVFFSLECFDQAFHAQKCQSQNIVKFRKINTVNCCLYALLISRLGGERFHLNSHTSGIDSW